MGKYIMPTLSYTKVKFTMSKLMPSVYSVLYFVLLAVCLYTQQNVKHW